MVAPQPTGQTPAVRESSVVRALRALRAIAVEIRHTPDRLLHSARRGRARRAIAGMSPDGSALFICHGNVCRSPFAAAIFARSARDLTGRDAVVSSAGFIGPGRQPPAPALAAALRRRIDMTGHRSSLITQARLDAASLVVVMSGAQERALRKSFGPTEATILVLGDLDPLPIRRRTVVDPWGGNAALFDTSYDRIERCNDEIFGVLAPVVRSQRADVTPSNDS